MPDRHDPMDEAYVEAEALLDDAAGRQARRARVLAAVGAMSDNGAAPAKRPSWPGRWLVAAGVAGVGVFVAVQVYRPPVEKAPAPAPVIRAPAGTANPAEAGARPAAIAKSPPPPVQAEPDATVGPAPPRMSTTEAPIVAPAQPAESAPPVAASAPPPPPPPALQRAAPAPSAGRASPQAVAKPAQAEELNEVVVTGARASSDAESRAAISPDRLGRRLRAAAAAGRVAEMSRLLDRGVLVDAPDEKGRTALMMSIAAGKPAAAALLLSHGADLDHENADGVSAREMAISIGEPEMNQALGLKP